MPCTCGHEEYDHSDEQDMCQVYGCFCEVYQEVKEEE